MGPYRVKACSQCKTQTQSVSQDGHGRCRGCYLSDLSARKIDEIKFAFRGAGELNKQIFQTYLKDLEQIKLKPSDVKVATRLADTLAGEPLEEIRSWREAWRLAGRLNIRYSNQYRNLKRSGDPVLKIAKELEKLGKIPADSSFAIRYEKSLQCFDLKTRQIVERFVDEVGSAEESKKSKLNRVFRLRHYQLYFKGRDILNPDPIEARAYFNSLTSRTVIRAYENWMQLRKFFRWSVTNGFSLANPFEDWHPEYLTRTCEKCRKTSLFSYHDRLCDPCHLDPLYLVRLDKVAQSFKAPSAYNQHLLDLHIRYLKSRPVRSHHLSETRLLMKMLESAPLPVIRSWRDIDLLSKELAMRNSGPLTSGNPIYKIGKMLEDLGVLPHRLTDRESLLENLYARCPEEISRVLRRYHDHLKKKGCVVGGRYGTTRTVIGFQIWLSQFKPELSLFTVFEPTVLQYLQSTKDGDRSGIRRNAINRFYRWAVHERLVLTNPAQGIPVPKIIRSMSVLSDHQIRQIESFVKNPESDAEYAIILALVLYWGLTTVELALSTIDIRDSQIWINLHRRQLGPGRKSHNRNQVLKLPRTPQWLAKLQRKFLNEWNERFEGARKSFPNQPLLLRRSSVRRDNRHVGLNYVLDLFYQATRAATGVRIPPNVVRRTSGHIHTHHGDASRLTKLGWSLSTASDFSTLQRRYFSPAKRR
jgi:hypothetical protein